MNNVIENLILTNSKSVHSAERYINLIKNFTGPKQVKHHILPKCLFPHLKHEKDNIINISNRLHLILHRLLVNIFDHPKMWTALILMSGKEKSSKKYESTRLKYSEYLSNKQNKLVKDGTHNLLGLSSPSHNRMKLGIHNFQGDKNPAKVLSKLGQHPATLRSRVNGIIISECIPWNTKKARKEIWKESDKIYTIFLEDKEMGRVKFAVKCKLLLNIDLPKSVAEKFIRLFKKKNWIPQEDTNWLKFKQNN